jgi:hypothetical protein
MLKLSQLNPVPRDSRESETALNVTVVYEDPLTRYWVDELWGRVGRLIGGGEVRRKAWRIGDLVQQAVFGDAARAAAKADVLVIAVRDTKEVPLILYVWIDAWLPRRAGLPGALVALIGVPAQPDAQGGCTLRLLEAVARKAGLDYLPRECKLPDPLPDSHGRPKAVQKHYPALAA